MSQALTLNTPMQLERLRELETVVEDGLATYVAVGLAIAEIRDQQLWRADPKAPPLWEQYCKRRWGWGPKRASQLIAAGKYATKLVRVTRGNHLVPPTEKAARRAMQAVSVDDLDTLPREEVQRRLEQRRRLKEELRQEEEAEREKRAHDPAWLIGRVSKSLTRLEREIDCLPPLQAARILTHLDFAGARQALEHAGSLAEAA